MSDPLSCRRAVINYEQHGLILSLSTEGIFALALPYAPHTTIDNEDEYFYTSMLFAAFFPLRARAR